MGISNIVGNSNIVKDVEESACQRRGNAILVMVKDKFGFSQVGITFNNSNF